MTALEDVVRRCIFATHDGYSTDDLIIDDTLNEAFIRACRKELPLAAAAALNWELLTLRKRPPGIGKVTRVTRHHKHDDYIHAAEIAARHMEDAHLLTIDRVLCDPEIRREFDSLALSIAPGISTYLLRKAALKLRKARQLQPELMKRVTDWGTTILMFAAEELVTDPACIPRLPGIYIFRDTTGYLYIGEAGDLLQRVRKHLYHSDRKALARYLWENGVEDLSVELHTFRKESDGNKSRCRKAYEAELIRSRKPVFNIQGGEV
jgi:hypothetical protein